MLTEQRSRFLLFGIASVTAHIAAIAFITAPLLMENISLAPRENSTPLQISLKESRSLQARQTVDAKPVATNKVEKQSNQNLKKPVEYLLHVSTDKPAFNNAQPVKLVDTENVVTRISQKTIDLIPDTALRNNAPAHPSPTPVSAQQSNNKNSAERLAHIQKKLDAVFDKYFNYPVFAVRRGWQGTVEIALRIEANGKLSNMRVIKTSGYRYLDQDALTTLSKADHINGLDDWLAGRHFDTTLPVEYRLTDG